MDLTESPCPSGLMLAHSKYALGIVEAFLLGILLIGRCVSSSFESWQCEHMFCASRRPTGYLSRFSLSWEACFLVGELCIQHAWMSTASTVGPQVGLLFLFALILRMFVTSNTLFCIREESIRFRLSFVWDSLSPLQMCRNSRIGVLKF